MYYLNALLVPFPFDESTLILKKLQKTGKYIVQSRKNTFFTFDGQVDVLVSHAWRKTSAFKFSALY